MSHASTDVSPRTAHAKSLFAGLPANYDRMGALLSFGQDPRWRRFMVSRVLVGPGARVLDVATGTGMVARELVRRTGASVVGVDMSEPMLRGGVVETREAGLGSAIRFALARAEALPFGDASFDAVTFTYLLRYVDDVGATVRELVRVVKPGGTLANLEFAVPTGLVRHPAWLAYTRGVMPLVGRVVSPAWHEVGGFLGRSVSDFYARHPLDEQLAAWRAAGVSDVAHRVMSLGGGVVIWGTRARGDG